MSDTVIPIHGGKPPGQPPTPSKRRSRHKRRDVVVLAESGEFDGFSTHDVIAGLNGVCSTLAERDYSASMDFDQVEQLGMAAKVLSAILCNRDRS
jgi:hypothetical protein